MEISKIEVSTIANDFINLCYEDAKLASEAISGWPSGADNLKNELWSYLIASSNFCPNIEEAISTEIFNDIFFLVKNLLIEIKHENNIDCRKGLVETNRGKCHIVGYNPVECYYAELDTDYTSDELYITASCLHPKINSRVGYGPTNPTVFQKIHPFIYYDEKKSFKCPLLLKERER